uniref:Tumor necrosis factor ligand superfamily member 10 n=1 Tax=Sphenodon punctatus TaxID=8508 RepID=A0A8D0H8S8_SPHPU
MVPAASPSSGLVFGLVLVFAVLLQSICVAVTFLYFTNELKQLRQTYSSSMACLTGENPATFLENVDQNEKDDPCSQLKWQLRMFIEKVRRTFQTEQAGTFAEGEEFENPVPRVAAHLTGSSVSNALATQNSSFRKGYGYKINTWEPSRKAHSFLYNVELKNGELIIPQTGFYYIYSQTYFRFREPEDADSESDASERIRNTRQMVQYVYKMTNYPEPILLMKSARSSCWSRRSEYGLYSVYQGGVFQLKRNERVFVSVSNEEIVDMDKEASFFGAFLITWRKVSK